jgi:hypothetical protein
MPPTKDKLQLTYQWKKRKEGERRDIGERRHKGSRLQYD